MSTQLKITNADAFDNVLPTDVVIQLTRGLETIVSGQHAWVKDYCKWHTNYSRSSVYARNRAHGFLHVFLAGGKAGTQVDHRNRNTLDNRDWNLICLPVGHNQHNRKAVGTVGYKGVTKDRKRYRARITNLDGEYENLGNFDTAAEAAAAYDRAARNIYGKYADVNFPAEQKVVAAPVEEEVPF